MITRVSLTAGLRNFISAFSGGDLFRSALLVPSRAFHRWGYGALRTIVSTASDCHYCGCQSCRRAGRAAGSDASASNRRPFVEPPVGGTPRLGYRPGRAARWNALCRRRFPDKAGLQNLLLLGDFSKENRLLVSASVTEVWLSYHADLRTLGAFSTAS